MLVFLLLYATLVVHVQSQILLEQLQRQYLEKGIPFRENRFLNNRPILEEYDFVVIGSGPGGSTVASRLSEVPNWTVLLLEQGQEANIYSDIPFISPITILGNFSKFYLVEKTKNACSALINGQCNWPAGEVLGGGSIVNAMLYTRGNPSDFDNWAAQGNPGWSYENVLPYFKKTENIAIESLKNSPYHGRKGPVQVEYSFQTKMGLTFVKAGKELAYDIVDYNNPNTRIGFSTVQATIKDGKRVSAASAFLLPNKSRKNLHIAINSKVVNILIDPVTRRAFGVRFTRKGRERIVVARKEVILSAGAFNSPKLLMLSGIGRKDHLERVGIPVIRDLPVGDDLQEHLGHPLLNFFTNTTDGILFTRLLRQLPTLLLEWLPGKKNLLSNTAAEAFGYIKTRYARSNDPDVELIFLPVTLTSDNGTMLRKTLAMRDDVYNALYGDYAFREGFIISPMGMYPNSRGTVRLRSNNPDDPPVVNGNFFADPIDVKTILEGIRVAQRLAKSKAFREMDPKLHSVPLPECATYGFDSDGYWECAIRAIPIQFHHQCGTCRMGPNPATSVVDSRLKVHGIVGLRVVDASVMPRMTGMHTMSPTYMIGEKAADLIKEEWLLQSKK